MIEAGDVTQVAEREDPRSDEDQHGGQGGLREIT